MGNEIRSVDRGPPPTAIRGRLRAMPGAVSPSLKFGSDGPDKSAGLLGAPMTTDPHAADRTGGPSFSPELRADLQKLPAAARKALLRK